MLESLKTFLFGVLAVLMEALAQIKGLWQVFVGGVIVALVMGAGFIEREQHRGVKGDAVAYQKMAPDAMIAQERTMRADLAEAGEVHAFWFEFYLRQAITVGEVTRAWFPSQAEWETDRQIAYRMATAAYHLALTMGEYGADDCVWEMGAATLPGAIETSRRVDDWSGIANRAHNLARATCVVTQGVTPIIPVDP